MVEIFRYWVNTVIKLLNLRSLSSEKNDSLIPFWIFDNILNILNVGITPSRVTFNSLSIFYNHLNIYSIFQNEIIKNKFFLDI